MQLEFLRLVPMTRSEGLQIIPPFEGSRRNDLFCMHKVPSSYEGIHSKIHSSFGSKPRDWNKRNAADDLKTDSFSWVTRLDSANSIIA